MQITKLLKIFLILFLMNNCPILSNPISPSSKIKSATNVVDDLLIKEKLQKENGHRFEGNNLVERGKYCYIVISMTKREIYIWSFLKAKHYSTDTFRFIKSKIIIKEAQIVSLIFEGGNILYINEDYLQYNGVKYDIGNYLNVFVEKDYIVLGRSIQLFK